jgi:hypothetical protein
MHEGNLSLFNIIQGYVLTFALLDNFCFVIWNSFQRESNQQTCEPFRLTCSN